MPWQRSWWTTASSASAPTFDANYAFHLALADLADNPLLSTTFGALSIKSVMTRSFGSTASTSRRSIDAQRALMEAFEQDDKEAARSAARIYSDLAQDRVRELISRTGGRL